MNHVDPELKTYAENGLRSAEDWATIGRQLKEGVKPRTQIMHRRQTVELYGRDQTLLRTRPAEVTPVTAPNA
jgi:hypothetical protein